MCFMWRDEPDYVLTEKTLHIKVLYLHLYFEEPFAVCRKTDKKNQASASDITV